MKYAAILTVLVLIVCLIGMGALYLTSNVTVEAVGVIATEASAQPDLFDNLQEQLRSGYVHGTPFTQSETGSANQYQFLTYTVRLKNNCFLTADMVELQVTPMQGDVMQLGDTSSKALPAHATGDIQATILTDINMHAVRELNVTYYMWGMPFTLRTAYGY